MLKPTPHLTSKIEILIHILLLGLIAKHGYLDPIIFNLCIIKNKLYKISKGSSNFFFVFDPNYSSNDLPLFI